MKRYSWTTAAAIVAFVNAAPTALAQTERPAVAQRKTPTIPTPKPRLLLSGTPATLRRNVIGSWVASAWPDFDVNPAFATAFSFDVATNRGSLSNVVVSTFGFGQTTFTVGGHVTQSSILHLARVEAAPTTISVKVPGDAFPDGAASATGTVAVLTDDGGIERSSAIRLEPGRPWDGFGGVLWLGGILAPAYIAYVFYRRQKTLDQTMSADNDWQKFYTANYADLRTSFEKRYKDITDEYAANEGEDRDANWRTAVREELKLRDVTTALPWKDLQPLSLMLAGAGTPEEVANRLAHVFPEWRVLILRAPFKEKPLR